MKQGTSEIRSEEVLVVDASDQVLGRLASRVAKLLLQGKRVVVVNAEKAVVSGDSWMVVESYKKLFEITNYRNLEKGGIRRPRNPVGIIKRTIRGMLPYQRPKGRRALKRLKVYLGVPEEYKNLPKIRFEEADASRLTRTYMTLKDLAVQLGWRGGG